MKKNYTILFTVSFIFVCQFLSAQSIDFRNRYKKQYVAYQISKLKSTNKSVVVCDSVLQFNYSATDSIQTHRTINRFDSVANQIASITYRWDTINHLWIDTMKNDFIITNNKCTESIVSLWNPKKNKWVTKEKDDYTFDANNFIYQDIYSLWDSTNNVWVNNSKYIYKDNAQRYDTIYEGYRWDKTIPGWLITQRDSITYNSAGKETLHISYALSYPSTSLSGLSKTVKTYNQSNQLVETITYNWDSKGLKWILYTKEDLLYDQNGLHANGTSEVYSASVSVWTKVGETEYTFDSLGNQTSYIYSQWDSYFSRWMPVGKSEQAFNSNGQQIMDAQYQYIIGIIYGTYKTVITLDANNLTSKGIYYTWNSNTNSWVPNMKNYYYNSAHSISDSLTEIPLQNAKVLVYPNPAKNQLTISTQTDNASITIYNYLGEILTSQKTNTDKTIISLEPFTAGIYFVSITVGTTTVIKKITVVK